MKVAAGAVARDLGGDGEAARAAEADGVGEPLAGQDPADVEAGGTAAGAWLDVYGIGRAERAARVGGVRVVIADALAADIKVDRLDAARKHHRATRVGRAGLSETASESETEKQRQ